MGGWLLDGTYKRDVSMEMNRGRMVTYLGGYGEDNEPSKASLQTYHANCFSILI